LVGPEALTNLRSVTIHCDVAAVVRWSLFGVAAVVLAVASLVVALRGDTNYPTTIGIEAVGATVAGSKPSLGEISQNQGQTEPSAR
jgi:hypothetical protein